MSRVVCLLVATVSSAKMAEPIEMPFGMLTRIRVGPKNPVLDGSHHHQTFIYLHHRITMVQPPRSTRSSSLVTLARSPTSSSLRSTDRCFRCTSLYWAHSMGP